MVNKIKGLAVGQKPELLRENLKRVSARLEKNQASDQDRVELSVKRPQKYTSNLLTELNQLISAQDLRDDQQISQKLTEIKNTYGNKIANEIERSLKQIKDEGIKALEDFKANIEQILVTEENQQAAFVNIDDLESATQALNNIQEHITENKDSVVSAHGVVNPKRISQD